MPILRRKSRLEMRLSVKAFAVSTMKVCLSCSLKLIGIPPDFVDFRCLVRGLLLERSEGEAADKLASGPAR